ncbi:MAG: cytochrome c3 family protein, partial [Coriobacteriia bacterium]|nr:cytochrome c3 family protein [Coriobacteriia bacterium]
MDQTHRKTMGVRWRARLSVLLCMALLFSVIPGMAFAGTPTVISDVEVSYLDVAMINISASVGATESITAVYYTVDGGSEVEVLGATATVTVKGYGAHDITYRAVDSSGHNSAAMAPYDFFIDDMIPPVVTDDALAAYHVVPAIINLSATDDDGSGVDSIFYTLNGGTTVTVAGASAVVQIPSVGSYALKYWASDVVGNESAPVTVNFTVDRASMDLTPPTTTHNAIAYYGTEPAVVTLQSEDVTSSGVAPSGMASLSYRIDGGATVVVTSTVDAPPVPVEPTSTMPITPMINAKHSVGPNHPATNNSLSTGCYSCHSGSVAGATMAVPPLPNSNACAVCHDVLPAGSIYSNDPTPENHDFLTTYADDCRACHT